MENGITGINIGNPFPHQGSISGIYKIIYGLVVAPTLGLILTLICYAVLYKWGVKPQQFTGWTSRILFSVSVFFLSMTIPLFFTTMLVEEPVGLLHPQNLGLLLGCALGTLMGLLFMYVYPKIIRLETDMRVSFEPCCKRSTMIKDKLKNELPCFSNKQNGQVSAWS